MGIRRTAIGGAVIGLVAPASALAGAVLDSPANNAVHTYSPLTPLTLSWHLDNGSTTRNVILSTGPTLQGGALADVFDSGGAGQTSWRPTAPMWAGTYWWQVETSDVGAGHFSNLGRFTEATVLHYSKWRVYHDRKHHNRLALALSYTTNWPQIKITLQLFNSRMKRLVKPIVRYDTPTGPNKTTNPTNINWLPARTVKKGTPVKIRITVTAGTKSVTQTISTKAS